MTQEIDTGNHQLVSLRGSSIVILAPKREMTPDEAVLHAAWLIAMAEPFVKQDKFSAILHAVQNT